MDHRDFFFMVSERLIMKPLNELFAIRGLEDILKIVTPARFARSRRDRHEMQIVIAQHHGDVITVREKPAQNAKIIGAAINDIAHAPKLILVGVELDTLQKLQKGCETTLNVANHIGAHSGVCQPVTLAKCTGLRGRHAMPLLPLRSVTGPSRQRAGLGDVERLITIPRFSRSGVGWPGMRQLGDGNEIFNFERFRSGIRANPQRLKVRVTQHSLKVVAERLAALGERTCDDSR